MIEEVKKILLNFMGDTWELMPTEMKQEYEDMAQQICQLFPKSPDNPDGYEPKPGRLLTDGDDVFIKEITKRCCGAPWGTVHEEVQYTALHFQSKTASIKEVEFKELCSNCESWLWKGGEAQEIVDKCESECQARVEGIFKEIEKKMATRNEVDIKDKKVKPFRLMRTSDEVWQALKKQEGGEMNKQVKGLIPRTPEAEKQHRAFIERCKMALDRRQKVEGLVEWGVKEVAYHFAEDWINTEVIAKKVVLEILSHSNLAWIDREKLKANLKFLIGLKFKPEYSSAIEECIIPLAEALKE